MQTTIEKLIETWGRVEDAGADARLDELESEILTAPVGSMPDLVLQMCVLTSKAEVAGLVDDLVLQLRESCRRNADLHLVGEVLHLAKRYVG